MYPHYSTASRPTTRKSAPKPYLPALRRKSLTSKRSPKSARWDSRLEPQLKAALDAAGISYVEQYEVRVEGYPSWLWDFYVPAANLLIDLDGGRETVAPCSCGGVSYDGFHQLPDGRARDNSKTAEAQLQGYTALRFTESQVEKGQAIATIRRAICETLEAQEAEGVH